MPNGFPTPPIDIDTGGPAFPQAAFDADGLLPNTGGMSLRDYFAAQAVSGGVFIPMNKSSDKDTYVAALAVEAYRVADALLKERSK